MPARKSGKKRTKKNLARILRDKEREIVHTEDALVETIRRFRDLFEQSPTGIGIYDTKGEVLMVNRSYLNIFGFDSFNIIGDQNLFTGLKLPAAQKKRLRAGKVVEHEQEFDFEKFKYPTSREGTGYIFFTVSPLFRENKIIAYMVQTQDITERKKIAESQRLAQLGRSLSDIAHEVNNPLMVISGRAELALMKEINDPELKSTLKTVLDQCFLAKDIIQRVLKYARRGKARKQPLDVGQTLDLIIEMLEHQFRKSNIVFKRKIPADIPKIQGDEKQLQEVLMNIMRNSADAMPGGGSISVNVSRYKKFVKVEIEDTGKGMDKKTLKHIFEPFYTTKHKGTGLGLAITHSIICEHGGELRYESEPKKGTTAIVTLPVAKRQKKGET